MMNNHEVKDILRGLVNTPFMPMGMYSQLCRDEEHYGQCSQCECWCHMQDKLSRIKDLLDEHDFSPGMRDEIAYIVGRRTNG